MGFLTTIESALPGDEFFSGSTVNFGVPWISLSVALNVTLTALICVRILQARRRVQGCLEQEELKVYTSVMAILIESALPFSILGIIFAVAYSKGWSLSAAMANIWGVFVVRRCPSSSSNFHLNRSATFQVVSPQFIILRVVMGRAWTRDIASRAGNRSSVAFQHGTTSHVQGITVDSETMEAPIVATKISIPSESSGSFTKVE